jgi:hypothetical protein
MNFRERHLCLVSQLGVELRKWARVVSVIDFSYMVITMPYYKLADNLNMAPA